MNKDEIKQLLQNTYKAYASALKLAKDAGLIEMTVIEEIKLQPYSDAAIVAIVKSYYHFDFTQKSRLRKFVDARHIACYILSKYTKLSLKDIAVKTGTNHHTTAYHGIGKIKDLIGRDSEVTYHVDMLCSLIESRFADVKEMQNRDMQINSASQGSILKVVEAA